MKKVNIISIFLLFLSTAIAQKTIEVNINSSAISVNKTGVVGDTIKFIKDQKSGIKGIKIGNTRIPFEEGKSSVSYRILGVDAGKWEIVKLEDLKGDVKSYIKPISDWYEGNVSLEINGKDTPVSVNSPFRLFFNLSQINEILSKDISEHSRLEENTIVYDVQSSTLKSLGSKDIRPKVDQFMAFKVVNFHPYKDSFTLVYGFGNKNIELKNTFASFVSVNPLATTKDSTSNTTNTSPSAQNGTEEEVKETKENLTTMKQFADSMPQLYDKLYFTSELNNVKLEQIIVLIRKNIREKFKFLNLNTLDPSELRDKGLEKIEADSSIVNKKDWKNGVKAYEKLLSFRSLTFPPIQIENADVTEITLSQFRDGKLANSKENKYTFFNKGGFKIDFSTGIFATNVFDYNYYTKAKTVQDTTYLKLSNGIIKKDSITKIEGVQKNEIWQEEQNKFVMGLGILAHAYFRQCKRLNGSITGGFLLDAKPRIKYLLGGSVILGSEQRLSLSGGIAIGEVKRLRTDYSIGNLLSSTETTVPTSQKWIHGCWIGVTYNLGK